MNVPRLITEMRQRRPLWDRSDERRRDKSLIEALWDEVAFTMGKSPKTIRNKWKTLKDSYRKEAKKSVLNPEYEPHWVHFKPLGYLFDQLNIEASVDPSEDPDHSTSTSFADPAPDPNFEFVYDEVPPEPEVKKIKLADVISSSDDPFHLTPEAAADDEDICFFKSLVPHVKQLSPQKKMLMRMKIQEIVYKEVYSNDLDD